ncbi:MAG: hypothetical protein ACE5JS_07645 [Nitrospinota bacterium]
MPLCAAAIDLGSLAVRLHIAQAPGKGRAKSTGAGFRAPFRSLHEERRISRLAENLEPGEDLSPEGQGRVLAILREFRAVIERFGVEPGLTRVVATEALRKARNGSDFARRIRTETGLSALILSPEEEARWTARGALLCGAAHRWPLLVGDPGGGSLEVVWIEGEGLELRHGSEPLGVLDLLRRFPLGAPAAPGALAELESAAQATIERLLRRVRPPGKSTGEGVGSLLVTGGTALNLGAISRKTAPHHVRAFFHSDVSRHELEKIYRRIASLDLEGRREERCLERGREDVIVPGLAVLRGLVLASGVGSLTVTHLGLREGILDALLRGKETPG